MKLDPTQQTTLLELASTERAIAAAGDRATETPEQQELDRLLTEQRRMRDAAASAQMAVDDMEAEILRIQEDERKLRRRERDNKAQLGAETDPDRRRDLEHDRYSAKSRIADLMAELQEAHNEIHALRNNRDVHGAKLDDLEVKIGAARRAADAANEAADAIQDPAEHIAHLRDQLPEDIVAEYERQKIENEVGVAAFNGRACGGCFIVLPPADRSAISGAAKDELPQCPNCGSYLVRRVPEGQ